MECRFCKRQAFKGRIVYEDKGCFAILNEYPASKGHVLVVSKKHYADMLSADDKSLDCCFEAAKKIAKRMRARLKPGRGIKLIVNMDGAEELRHMHIHVMPVYGKDLDLNVSYKERPELAEKARKELMRKLA